MGWLARLFGRSQPAPAAPSARPVDPRRRPQTAVQAIATGWNGLRWGATVAEFRARFPDAQSNGDWLLTGLGQEAFCGLFMDAQYAFNRQGQLYMVALLPKVEDRAKVSVAAVNELGAPDDMNVAWTRGDAVIEVKTGGIVVTITSQRFANR
jgi:hypothetical protein